MLLAPLYADECATALVRLSEGESLFSPHRRHIYQIFANQAGFKHWKISAAYAAVQCAIGLCAALLVPYGIAAELTLTATVLCGGLVVRRLASAVERMGPETR